MHVICYLMPIACSGVNSLEENVYCDVYFISRGYLCDPLEIIKKSFINVFLQEHFLFLKKNLSIISVYDPSYAEKKKKI